MVCPSLVTFMRGTLDSISGTRNRRYLRKRLETPVQTVATPRDGRFIYGTVLPFFEAPL